MSEQPKELHPYSADVVMGRIHAIGMWTVIIIAELTAAIAFLIGKVF